MPELPVALTCAHVRFIQVGPRTVFLDCLTRHSCVGDQPQNGTDRVKSLLFESLIMLLKAYKLFEHLLYNASIKNPFIVAFYQMAVQAKTLFRSLNIRQSGSRGI